VARHQHRPTWKQATRRPRTQATRSAWPARTPAGAAWPAAGPVLPAL